MSTQKIQQRFELDSPADLVWQHLTDPHRTVSCLPGAEITGQDDERTYSGNVIVKVGAVTIAYRGRAVFEEIDHDRRYLRVVGKGREKSGSGSVEMTMESRVGELDGRRSEVTVDSEVRLTGRIVRFGRGMIDSVSQEILKEFRSRLAAALQRELDATGESGAEGVASPEPNTGARAASDDALPLLPLLWRAFRGWLARLFGRG